MRTVWIRNRLVLLMVCVVILAWVSFSSLIPNSFLQTNDNKAKQEAFKMLYLQRNLPDPGITKETSVPRELTEIMEKVKSIAKLIHNAKKHVRGSKTSDFLKQATETMDSLLTDINIDPHALYKRTVYEPVHVCPEKYMGTTFGYPFFYKGFETTTCSQGVPIWKLVTIVTHIGNLHGNHNSSLDFVEKFVSSVYELSSNFSMKLSANNSKYLMNLKMKYPLLTVVDSNRMSDGMALNLLVREVKTPYVFVARNVQLFTNDSRLERLIREIETLKVKVASGAVRDADGHWRKGCFQSVHRNFSLRYLEGYDESFHECLICDFAHGPFVTSKEYLEKNKFESFDVDEGLFEDWFLRISQSGDETIVCPDSMFHIAQANSLKTQTWTNFMQKWNLFKVITSYGNTLIRKCSDSKTSTPGARALSPCSLQSNADAVKTIMKVCEEANIFCELQEGTALGAVKLGKTLPWERDADITFLTANYSTFQNLQSTFDEKGFSFTDLGSTWCCADKRQAGGKFKLGYSGWSIELYGQHMMDSELMVEEGMKPTKVQLDGQWVMFPRNPGLFVRNRYGREIYQHAEHWLTTGEESGWINYKTNVFKPCVSLGDHDCLDRYNADGDLPFIEMLP